MKTFTIHLIKGETNFGQRSIYEFSKEANSFFIVENNQTFGKPLEQDMVMFCTMMTKKEAEDLKLAENRESMKSLETLQKSIKRGDPSQ